MGETLFEMGLSNGDLQTKGFSLEHIFSQMDQPPRVVNFSRLHAIIM